MEISLEELNRLGKKVVNGTATAQEKVYLAGFAGVEDAWEWLPTVRGLLLDADSEVRKYALQGMVLDFGVKDAGMFEFCRQRVLEEEDEDARSMAAVCLGNIGWNSKDPELFRFLEGRLDDELEEPFVRGGVYNALMSVMGVHPRDGWFGIDFSVREVFDPARHIDRDKLARLKAQLETEQR